MSERLTPNSLLWLTTLLTASILLSCSDSGTSEMLDAAMADATTADGQPPGDAATTGDAAASADTVASADGPGADGAPQADSTPSADGPSSPTNPLTGIGQLQTVKSGFNFLEGPHWRKAGELLFSDIPENKIYRLLPPSAISTFRPSSGNANGLATDIQGQLLAAEHGNRRVSFTEAGGAIKTLVDTYQGQKLNSPNDIAVRSDGTIYFTDPPYGISSGQQELSFNGVFRFSNGVLTAEHQKGKTARPNGIALSPDESKLYVADTSENNVRVYDVAQDGSLSASKPFAAAASPDGMAVDSDGNLYVTTSGGVKVIKPNGTTWGTIQVPQQPANCAFGGANLKTLYITARTALYSVSMVIAGHPIP